MSRRFRVALSFSGEKRPFVAEVARLLADTFGEDRVLYDKYHEAEFSRPDLAFHLPVLYHEQSDLVVAVLSQGYDSKEWCGLEWNAIYALIKKRAANEVMLTRFDLVEGQGLFGLAGFSDLDHKTPHQTATLILERLALNEGYPKDHYAPGGSAGGAGAGPDWPDVAPPLDWPVADHTEAQRAFAQLITRTSPFRLLSIHGGSETGKSHLTKQFLGNAFTIPALACGRFDFKGSSDMDAELRTFAQQLDVPTPGQGTVSAQLAQVFASVKSATRPTLLIFDTFERAGDAERWVRENLLLSIIRAPWLRVILVGQRLVQPHGEPWARFSGPPVELRSPTPQEWFTYGQAYKPGLTLDFVRQAHEFAEGKSGLLAQLLGPSN